MMRTWWWPMFAWWLNVLLVNSWKLYLTINEKGAKDCHLLDFLREVVNDMLQKHGTEKKRPERSSSTGYINPRKHESGHWPDKAESKYGRCRVCKQRAVYKCIKCNVPLHPECMMAFHEDV